ncbi:MAG: hypothetical protein U1A72_16855, partial [Sulfuritalea sp.]|nr:hypothetical protein [Sulfuritalea sp.]
KAAAARYLAGDAGALPFEMNWAAFTSSEAIEDAVGKVAGAFKGSFDKARRGTVSDDALKGLADRLGMTADDLLARRRGEAFSAERILAAKAIVEAAAEKTVELARVARESPNAADMAAFRHMLTVHGALQRQFQGAASEAGRALRALQLPTGSRARQLADIEEMLTRQGGAGRVRSLAEAVSQIADPAQIDRLARDGLGKRLADMAVEAWYFALLSGPQTHVVNTGSSLMNTLWQIPERALAARFGQLRGATDSVAGGEATEMLFGLIGSLGTGLRAAGRAFLKGESSDVLGKVEPRVPTATTAENFGLSGPPGSMAEFFGHAIDGFGTFLRLPTRAIMAEDEWFRVVGKDMQVRALALRQVKQEGLEGEAAGKRLAELYANPTDEMLEGALDFTRSLTFTTPLGDAGRSFQRAVNSQPAFKLVLPFVRTPMNLGKWVGTRSPLAPLAKSVRDDIAAAGVAGDLAMARIAMGSTVALRVADLALSGEVTGSGPTEPALRETWRRSHPPYSVRVGDTWYSYNRSDPFGMLAGIAADYAAIFAQIDDKDADDIAMALAIATSKSVMSKTWMRGPSEFIEALNNPDRFGERWVQQTLGTFLVPTVVAQVARTVDPVWREVDSIMDAVKARTPGYSKDLPPRRNLWGEAILSEGGLGPDLLSPIYKYAERDRPIDTWMFENRVAVTMPTRATMGVELTPHQYSRFVELAGNAVKDPATGLGAYDTLNAVIAGGHPLSGRWAAATDGPEGGRSLIVRRVVQSLREAARAKMIEEFPELRLRVEDRFEERGRALERTLPNPQRGRLP